MDARKTALREKAALALVQEVDDPYVSRGKGKDVVHLDLRKEKPDRATLLRLLLRPTGTLRTPTLRKGRTLLVGFDEAIYEKILK